MPYFLKFVSPKNLLSRAAFSVWAFSNITDFSKECSKKKREIFFWVKEHPDMSTQCTDGESNKIVSEKKTTVTA